MNAGNGSTAGFAARADHRDQTADPLPVERAGLATALRPSGVGDRPGRRLLAELPGRRDRDRLQAALYARELGLGHESPTPPTHRGSQP